ncbi:MAG: hypothetical protein HQK66_08330 [Desulfamplus sp.]|nr:hypothetical protein [Desulfamplus sp.]
MTEQNMTKEGKESIVKENAIIVEEKEKSESNDKTRWHVIFGDILSKLLTPVNISVEIDVSVMSSPPKSDILLVRRESPEWTKAQLQRLPDGIRDTRADHILLEFKFTESVNQEVIAQALGYDTFYKRANEKIEQKRIQTFILSSKTPDKKLRKMVGFKDEIKPGVFKSSHAVIDSVQLISINDLSDEPHNLYIKCFASKKGVREKSFNKLFDCKKETLTSDVIYVITGLFNIFAKKIKGAEIMQETSGYTTEEIMGMGKEICEALLNVYSLDDILKKYKPEEVFANYKPEEVFANYKPEEVLANYKPEEVLANYKPEERLKGLGAEEIKKYLESIKNNLN